MLNSSVGLAALGVTCRMAPFRMFQGRPALIGVVPNIHLRVAKVHSATGEPTACLSAYLNPVRSRFLRQGKRDAQDGSASGIWPGYDSKPGLS
jgi:hypothetical protein